MSCDDSRPSRDYSHIALDVSKADYLDIERKLSDAGVRLWKGNKSEGNSLYILDPDGHKLEIHVGDLRSRLEALKLDPPDGLELF